MQIEQPSPNASVYSDVYDCDAQAANYRWNNTYLQDLYRGKLRFDAFLFKEVVIRDAALIDGLLFWNAATSGWLETLPLNRIAISSRTDSIEGAIIQSFVRTGSDTLVPYVLDSFPQEASALTRAELAQRSASEVRTWRDIPRLLRSIGVAPNDVDRLEEGWGALIAYDQEYRGRERRLRVRRWTDIPFQDELHLLLFGQRSLLKLHSEAGREAVDQVVALRSATRSDIATYLRNSKKEALTATEKLDFSTVEAWYNSAYNRICARSGGAGLADVSDIAGSAPFDPARKLFDDAIADTTVYRKNKLFDYPEEAVLALGKMESGEFDRLMNEQASLLEMWYRDANNTSHLQKAVDALVGALPKTGFEKNEGILDWAAPPLVVFGMAVAAGVGVLVATERVAKQLEEPLDRRGLFGKAIKGMGYATAYGATKAVEKGGEQIAGAWSQRSHPIARRIVQTARSQRMNQ